MTGHCLWIPPGRDGPWIGVGQFRFARFNLLDQEKNRLKQIDGFETGHHRWHPVSVEKGTIGIRADDHGNVAGQQKTVDRKPLAGQRRQRRRNNLVGRNTTKKL